MKSLQCKIWERRVHEEDRQTLRYPAIAWWQRVKFALFAQTINQAVKRIINQAYVRGMISSVQFDALQSLVDRAVFPEVTRLKEKGDESL